MSQIIGIDLGLHTVKACVINTGLRRSQVQAVHEATVEEPAGPRDEDQPDLDDLGRALLTTLRMLRDNGLMHLPAAVALPGSAASYRSLGFPFSDAKRIQQAVAFEIDGQFPVSTDELAVDHIVVPPVAKGGPGRALVVAVRGDIIERVSEAFRAVGVELRLITVGAIATAQAMQAVEVAPRIEVEGDEAASGRAATLVVDIGERTTEIVALTETGPVAARALRRGGRQATRALARAVGIDVESAEVSKHSQGGVLGFGQGPHAVLAALTKAMTPVLREIDHTRQWLRTECETDVTEIRLTGGGSQLHGLSEWISHETGVPVLPATPKPNFELRGFETMDGARSLAALGAAIGAARRPLLQLRDIEAAARGTTLLEDRFGSLMTLGVAVLAFAGVQTVIHIKALERERNAYEEELAAITTELFGQELINQEQVEAALSTVEGADRAKIIPERGALEVLAMLSRTVKPTEGPPPVAPEGGPKVVPVVPADGQPGTMELPEEAPTLAPVPPDAGIVFDDQLVVSYADVREVKIKMIVSATRATAQDRLALKLEDIACVSGVQKGKIRDINDIKQFEMNVNHNCFRGSLATGARSNASDEAAEEEEGE